MRLQKALDAVLRLVMCCAGLTLSTIAICGDGGQVLLSLGPLPPSCRGSDKLAPKRTYYLGLKPQAGTSCTVFSYVGGFVVCLRDANVHG